MNPDFVDLLRAFAAADVRYLVVGAYAVSLHSRPRGTGDLDLWVEPTPDNAVRVMAALKEYGAPVANLAAEDFTTTDSVVQIGVAPRRIDLLTTLTGVSFAEAWPLRVEGSIGDVACPVIGREALVRNKRALGRPRDLADLEMLGG